MEEAKASVCLEDGDSVDGPKRGEEEEYERREEPVGRFVSVPRDEVELNEVVFHDRCDVDPTMEELKVEFCDTVDD